MFIDRSDVISSTCECPRGRCVFVQFIHTDSSQVVKKKKKKKASGCLMSLLYETCQYTRHLRLVDRSVLQVLKLADFSFGECNLLSTDHFTFI